MGLGGMGTHLADGANVLVLFNFLLCRARKSFFQIRGGAVEGREGFDFLVHRPQQAPDVEQDDAVDDLEAEAMKVPHVAVVHEVEAVVEHGGREISVVEEWGDPLPGGAMAAVAGGRQAPAIGHVQRGLDQGVPQVKRDGEGVVEQKNALRGGLRPRDGAQPEG